MPSAEVSTTSGNCPAQLAAFMGTDAVERLLDRLGAPDRISAAAIGRPILFGIVRRYRQPCS